MTNHWNATEMEISEGTWRDLEAYVLDVVSRAPGIFTAFTIANEAHRAFSNLSLTTIANHINVMVRTHVLTRLNERLSVHAAKTSEGTTPVTEPKKNYLTWKKIFPYTDTNPYEGIHFTRRNVVLTGESGKEVFRLNNVEAPDFWSDRAVTIAAEKYFAKGIETSVRDMIDGVAGAITNASVDQGYFEYGVDANTFYNDLRYALIHQFGAFNSPVWFNVRLDKLGLKGSGGNWAWDAKTDTYVEMKDSYSRPQCSACFIIELQDNLVGEDGLCDLWKNEARLFKYGSGSGVNYSKIREKGAILSAGGCSSGLMSFLKVGDSNSGAVKSGGTTRRSARMVCLDVDHPEVIDFIQWKSKEEKKARTLIAAGYSDGMEGEAYTTISGQNANNSVRVPDPFMDAVENDLDWYLTSRMDGKIVRKMKAREIWHEIAASAWECGDPGLQFHTTVNAWNTIPNSAEISGSNPCMPDFATVMTPKGVVPLRDVDAGSVIWSGFNWTKIVRKVSTGVKPVFCYKTDKGSFVGTETHRVMQHSGTFICAKDAQFLLCSTGTDNNVYVDLPIVETLSLGDHPVWDIEVEDQKHTLWTGGILVHNCGEFLSKPNSACNLACLRLTKFLNAQHLFDDALFSNVCKLFALAQDILVDYASYPTKKIAQGAHEFREIGLGYADLGSLIMLQGKPYDSDYGRQIAAYVTSLMTASAYSMSVDIAKHKGPYTHFETNRAPHLHVLSKHVDAHNTIKDHPGFVRRMWNDVYNAAEDHGVRNAFVSLAMPAGTVGFMMDCDTTGIEPLLGHIQYKNLAGGGKIKIVNQNLDRALLHLGYTQTERAEIIAYVMEKGEFQGAPHLDTSDVATFDTSFPSHNAGRYLFPMAHVKMVAAVTPFFSMGISKTINCPSSTTVEEIKDLYMQAWKMGLKSITIYRDGCKSAQPVSTKVPSASAAVPSKTVDTHVTAQRKLPPRRRGNTWEVELAGHKLFIRSGEYDNGSLGEVFLTMAKEGQTIRGLIDAFGVAISLGLQYGVPLEKFIEKFTNTNFSPAGMVLNHPTIRFASSLIDLVMRIIGVEYLKRTDLEHVHGQKEIVPVSVESALAGRDSHSNASGGSTQPFGESGPPCPTCSTLMVRNASCWRCTECGTTLGCS